MHVVRTMIPARYMFVGPGSGSEGCAAWFRTQIGLSCNTMHAALTCNARRVNAACTVIHEKQHRVYVIVHQECWLP